MTKGVAAAVLISISLGVLVWGFGGRLLNSLTHPESKDITLTIWGWDSDETVLKAVLPDYFSTHPDIHVNFVKQTLINYSTRLDAQLQAGKGPDIFPIHSSWVGMLSGNLSAAPSDLVPLNDFTKAYYPMIKESLAVNNKISGLPVELDGLGLFYNPDILSGVASNPPKSWTEFLDLARKATVKNTQGQFVTAGAALGSTTNIDYWPEILATLFLEQPNGSLSQVGNQDGVEVLQFFTSFTVDPKNKTWDGNLPNNLKMFSDGRLLFYFGKVGEIRKIKDLNPGLNFKVVPVPQLSNKLASVGSFWSLGVSNRSLHQREAWELTRYLTSQKILQDSNNLRAQNGAAPRIYPYLNMASLQISEPSLSAFIQQGPIYQGTYLNSGLSDSGINDEIITTFKTALDRILQGQDPLTTLQGITPTIQGILTKYHSK